MNLITYKFYAGVVMVINGTKYANLAKTIHQSNR